MSWSILIVDDHSEFLNSAERILAADGFDVVGHASEGEEALQRVAELVPDLVLLDIQLPGLDGFEIARRLTVLPTPPAVVLTSSRDPADYGDAVQAAPVTGFVGKHELSGARIAALLPSVG